MLALEPYENHAGYSPDGVSQSSRNNAEHEHAPIQGSPEMHLQLCKGSGIAHEAVTCAGHEPVEILPQG